MNMPRPPAYRPIDNDALIRDFGNGADLQRKIDICGQMFDWAELYPARGGRLDAVANFIAAHWHAPDQGLWDRRGPPARCQVERLCQAH
jgi:hypothetical protein